MQSVHDKTLLKINRGHDYKCFLDAYEKTKNKGINVNIDDFYRKEVDCLGIDAKKRLVALLNASLSLHEKLSKEKYLLNKVAGAWKDDESAEDTIARIVSSRTNRTSQLDFSL